MTKRTMADYLYRMLKDERRRGQMSMVLDSCKNTRISKLWEILFETDVRDAEILESLIFEFGSMIKEDDVWGREIFVCLVAFLNLVIK